MDFPFHLTDQTNGELIIHQLPCRIVSLVPSITQSLIDWGFSEKIIGITSFCPSPGDHAHVIGGTKTVKTSLVKDLSPDLIIGNKEENTKEIILELQKEFPVYLSDILTLDDALEFNLHLGMLTGAREKADSLNQELERGFQAMEQMLDQAKRKVLYFIWRNPYMIAGNDTFINDMIEHAGFENLGKHFGSRYPEITRQQVKRLQPDLIFLSSEPYRFNRGHFKEWEDLIPLDAIVIVDARYFSWYGSQLRNSPTYFRKLHQQLRNSK